jgi:hypothetical protein
MVRKFLRAIPALCLLACSAPADVPLLIEGQPNEPIVLPVVMREVAALAGADVRRICVAQADDAFSETRARPLDPAVLAPLVAVDMRVTGDLRACRLLSWNEPAPPDPQFVVVVFYRNGARWVLDMAARSTGGDGFDRSWYNDYLRRYKSGHALVFVRLDRSIHFFEVEQTARGPRVVGTDVQGTVEPEIDAPESDGLSG